MPKLAEQAINLLVKDIFSMNDNLYSRFQRKILKPGML